MSSDERISYLPTEDTVYDPSNALYWDPKSLASETTRAFEICHGCRMCFKYCDSFPNLFKALDDQYDGDVTRLNEQDVSSVMDACFQCKLCEVQCPYTPSDDHEFQMDFPKLVHRYKAIRHRKEGSKLRDRMLADPDKAGRMARASLGLADRMNRVKVHRWFMETFLGIHRDKLLPPFASSTFEAWANREGYMKEEAGGEAVLFQTCYVQNNEPQIGRDTLTVMDKNSVDCRCVKGLECCGMPAWEQGDLASVRKHAKANLDKLLPFVEKGAVVLAINPTCSMMLRREYPELLEGEDQERAKQLAAAVRDPSEFLWSIKDEARFSRDFKSSPAGPVAYHAPCHLRAQRVGFRGRDLLRLIPNTKPKMVMECCGHDGTYAMKVEGFDASQRVGKKSFDGMKDAETEYWSTDCPLAAIQFEQHAGVKPIHPMSMLARAYREDGFETKVEQDEGVEPT